MQPDLLCASATCGPCVSVPLEIDLMGTNSTQRFVFKRDSGIVREGFVAATRPPPVGILADRAIETAATTAKPTCVGDAPKLKYARRPRGKQIEINLRTVICV